MVRRKTSENLEAGKENSGPPPPLEAKAVCSTETTLKLFIDHEDDDGRDDERDDERDGDWTPPKNQDPVPVDRPKRTSSRLKRSMNTLSEFYCEPQRKSQRKKGQPQLSAVTSTSSELPSTLKSQNDPLVAGQGASPNEKLAAPIAAAPAAPVLPAVPVVPATPAVSAAHAAPAAPSLSIASEEQPKSVDSGECGVGETTAERGGAVSHDVIGASAQAAPETKVAEIGVDARDDEESDGLPDIVPPAKENDEHGEELPDIVEMEAAAPSVEGAAPSSASAFTRPSLEPPPPTKRPKAVRGKKAAGVAAGKSTPKPKLPIVPETAEIASLSRKLSALEKQDLIDIIKRAVYFGKAPTIFSLESDIPKPNVKEFVKEIKRLKSAVMKAVPRNWYGSNRDHYSFLRCQSALNEFAKVASEQISVLGKMEDWNGCLEYALSAGCIIMELPIWDSEGDNYHESRLTGQLMGLLCRAVPKLSFSSGRAQALLQEIDEKRATSYLNVVVKMLEKLI